MTERTKYNSIREKLLKAEVKAPKFEDLLSKEDLDELALHTALSSKLSAHETDAPDFDSMFSGVLLGTTQQPIKKKRSIALWGISALAAACLALALLINSPVTDKAVVPTLYSQQKQASKTPETSNQLSKPNFKTANIAVIVTKKSNPTKTEGIDIGDFEVDSKSKESTATKQKTDVQKKSIVTTEGNGLSIPVRHIQSRPKLQKNKITLSAGANGSSRLLSLVNSRENGGFTLNANGSGSNDGVDKLEGARTATLRSSTSSVNEWKEVDNIVPSMLAGFKTNYRLPINIGLTVSIPIGRETSFITGLQYSYIANDLSGTNFSLHQELHYIGIPAKISLNLVKRKNLVVYAIGGGTIEKGLVGIQKSDVQGVGRWESEQEIEGIAASLCGGFGASYDFSKKTLLYVEPGVSWYIPTNQPVCLRTEEPIQFNVSIGLRYRF